jgi:hypothetical protein
MATLAESAQAGWRWAQCVAHKRTSNVSAFLDGTDKSAVDKAEQALSRSLECLNFEGGALESEGQVLNMPTDIERGALAEAMLHNKPPTTNLSANSLKRAYSAPWTAFSARHLSVDEMAVCVADTNPAGIAKLLATRPYEAEEDRAVTDIAPSLGVCLAAGVKLSANRQGIRAALAEALYHRVRDAGKPQ